MGEFFGEVIVRAFTFLLGTLAEIVSLQTAVVVLPIVSFGALTAKDRFRHPPAYGERRPTVVGPTFAVLFGMAFWTFAVIAAIALLR
jgi:hypothetical protein